MKFRNLFTNVYVKHIGIAILLVIALIFAVLQWLNSYTHHGEQVAVPDVKGMQVEEAEAFFNQKMLQSIVVDSIYVKNKPAGSILETVPPIGTHVKEGRTIYLTINVRNAHLLTVPAVTDMSQRQALSILRSVGFEKINTRTVSGMYKDLVVGLETTRGQTVNIGSNILANTALVLLVSSGNAEGMFLPDSTEMFPEDSAAFP